MDFMELRKRGFSYSMISEKIDVSKSTLSDWLGSIPYKANRQVKKRIGLARAQSGNVKSKLRLDSINRARTESSIKIGAISNRDILMAGLGIYIGEGTKTHGIIRVINANPKVIRFAIKWFTKSFGLDISNFYLRIHVYPDNNIQKAKLFWKKETGIPLEQFYNTQVDRRKNKKMGRRGKLEHGTAHLSIKSNGDPSKGVYLSRLIEAMMEKILQ